MKKKNINFSIEDVTFSHTRYVSHVHRKVTFLKNTNAIKKPLEMKTSVIILSGGGLVLPYFKTSFGRWKIVLVGQFRPAVKAVTLEAPGGRLDSQPPRIALSRELFEETGIKIAPRSIDIVVSEYAHPSILNTKHIGGIVKIKAEMVKDKKFGGNGYENEWTEVKVFDLAQIMKKREANLVTLDLMTSRLIDEVAKTVGLLLKKYRYLK